MQERNAGLADGAEIAAEAEVERYDMMRHCIDLMNKSGKITTEAYGVVKFNQLSASDTPRQCVFEYIVESSVLSRFFYEVLP